MARHIVKLGPQHRNKGYPSRWHLNVAKDGARKAAERHKGDKFFTDGKPKPPKNLPIIPW